DLAEPAKRAANGLQVGESATQPTFGNEHLAASLGCIFDRFLRLLFSADEKNFAPLANRFGEKITSFLQPGERFAQVNDVYAVACVKNEPLHFWVPTLGLMTKVNTRFQ